MIWVPNQLIGAPKGTNVTLECNTEAFPRAISYWVYDNMMILTAVKYFTETVETNYRTQMRLTIRNLKERDFGTYKCLSKNSLGETEGSIRLYGKFKILYYIRKHTYMTGQHTTYYSRATFLQKKTLRFGLEPFYRLWILTASLATLLRVSF